MTTWEITGRQSTGDSHAIGWEDAYIDVAEMLDKALSECIITQSSALYVEMWPDSGRFICYPASHPVNGNLAERTSEFLVQLMLPFWQVLWLNVSPDFIDSVMKYEKLQRKALEVLAKAFANLASQRADLGQLLLYSFEFEGVEGVTVITRESVYELR